MLKIALQLFFTALLMADGPVFKTGQTTEYRTGDDGTYQMGIDHRFSRDNINNTVTDMSSGLMWEDDAVDSNMTWSAAGTKCTNLILDGFEDWRLPTVEELVSITDKNQTDPAIYTVFQNTALSVYWSSTVYVPYTSWAWNVNFNNADDSYSAKTASYYVRCVRNR